MSSNKRISALKNWLSECLDVEALPLLPLSGDASFRRYLRLRCGDSSYIVMDAPPEKESSESFVAITNTFRGIGLNTPEIYAADLARGFLLLTDFGDRLYLEALNEKTAPELYQRAFDNLLTIQSCQEINGYTLPSFDEALYLSEMNLFKEWYLGQYLCIELTASERAMLDRIFKILSEDALAQPQVCVHRDYHSRNLMVLDDHQVGILDFQDAVWGAVTYDLLSLLRDCYIAWPQERVEHWVLEFHKQALSKGVIRSEDPKQFLRGFDWIGLQRHLKCMGIFARLYVRDNKPGYLQDIPRVLNYARRVCNRYPEFSELGQLLKRLS